MPPVRPLQRLASQFHLNLGPKELGTPQHAANGGTAKELERHRGGHGIARQTQQRGVAEHTKRQRFARPHAHTPELDVALFGEDVFDQVIGTDGDTARGQDQVGPGRRAEVRAEVVGAVACDAKRHGSAPASATAALRCGALLSWISTR